MAGVKDALEVVLKNEGGFVNHPADKGGPTNWGITQGVYEKFKGRTVTLDEMKNMPLSDAVAIYKKDYWDKIGGDALKYYSVALALFDQAVNRGTSTVTKQVQNLLGLTADGVFGPKTIAAVNAMPDTTFIPMFLQAAENSYKAIVNNNPSQQVFLNGWLNRVKHLTQVTAANFGKLNTAIKVGSGLAVFLIVGIAGYFLLKGNQR